MLGTRRGIDHANSAAEGDERDIVPGDELIEPGTVLHLTHGRHPIEQVLQLRLHRNHDADGHRFFRHEHASSISD
jgi:hypothetical protein